MAPAPLRRVTVLGLAAVLAAMVVIGLALHGRRPDPGLVRFEPAGLMAATPPERVTAVEVEAGDHRLGFERTSSGWRSIGGPALTGDLAGRVELGLRFLRVTAPQRLLSAEEWRATPAAEFGLDPPRYHVTVRRGPERPFVVYFGATNAQGLAQYVRVDGRDELALLPRFVGEAWEAVLERR